MHKLTHLHRLLTPTQFQNVFTDGKKKYYRGITIIACKNSLITPRIGFAISKKQIKKAVTRNNIKRIGKETFRLQQKKLAGIDYIVLVNKLCLEYNKKELFHYFTQAWHFSAKQFVHSS